LDTGNDGYVVPSSNSGILPVADSRTLDGDTIATSVDDGVVIDLSSIPNSINAGNAAAPSPAVLTKGLMMFNFNHTEEELRFIIQAVESKIAALQSFLQKLVMTANAQAQAQNGQSAATVVNTDIAANTPTTVTVPVDSTNPTSVDLSSADAGTVTTTS